MNYDAEKLRVHQIKSVDLLKKILILLEDYDIKYFASAGTLLGAVRHKGFIPWYDDIDIFTREHDYWKLHALHKKDYEIFQKYGLRINTNKKDPYYFFISESYKYHESPFVDIFPVQYYVTPLVRHIKFINVKLLAIALLLDCKGLPLKFKDLFPIFKIIKTTEMESKLYKIILPILLFPRILWLIFLPILFLMLRGCQSLLVHKKGKWVLAHSRSHYPDFHGMVENIYPRKKILFEGVEMWGPNHPHAVLKSYFGSGYMTPPPKNKQVPIHLKF